MTCLVVVQPDIPPDYPSPILRPAQSAIRPSSLPNGTPSRQGVPDITISQLVQCRFVRSSTRGSWDPSAKGLLPVHGPRGGGERFLRYGVSQRSDLPGYPDAKFGPGRA
jgi:hypothetical protein